MSNTFTTVRLLGVPLENDYKHTFHFDTVQEQEEYFINKTLYTANECSYQRKEKLIRFPACIDNINGCNYVMYKNASHSSKWHYAFIVDKQYKNDEMTEIYIETDVLQEWLNYYIIKPSFVEREHVENDTIGLHTIPEDLNVGQIVSEFQDSVSGLSNASEWYWFVVACNYDPEEVAKYAGVATYGGYPQGAVWFAFPIYPLSNETGINTVSEWVNEVVSHGQAESIQCMFALPWQMIEYSKVGENHRLSSNAVEKFIHDKTFTKSQLLRFNDFTPRNNKMYCYPYLFLRLTNNSGSFNDFKIEDFAELDGENQITDNVTFRTYATACIGVSGKVLPISYQGVYENDDEAIPLGKYPTLSWSGDAYTNWLTQNAVNMGVGLVGGMVSGAGAGFAVGGPAGAVVGAVVGGVAPVVSSIGGMYQASMLPNTAQGNANAGDVNFNHNRNAVRLMKMRAKKEYLQVIDEFFTMYGYKVNRMKTPSKNHRENYWFVKTQNVNIDANIPTEDLQKIKTCYNNGVTFWKNHDKIGDYTITNNCVS